MRVFWCSFLRIVAQAEGGELVDAGAGGVGEVVALAPAEEDLPPGMLAQGGVAGRGGGREAAALRDGEQGGAQSRTSQCLGRLQAAGGHEQPRREASFAAERQDLRVEFLLLMDLDKGRVG